MRIKILFEEEQEILREAYRLILSKHPRVDVVEAGREIFEGGVEDIERIFAEISPQVVLVGVREISPSAVRALRIARKLSDVGIILLFASWSPEGLEELREFVRRGISKAAFVRKFSLNSPGELIELIFLIAGGRVIIESEILRRLLGGGEAPFERLTAREREILSLIAEGYRNSAIAHLLKVEVKTVEHYVNSIFSKLNADLERTKHPRVQAALSYLRATGRLYDSAELCGLPAQSSSRIKM